MRRREKMTVPCAVTREERTVWATRGARSYLYNLVRYGVSPRLAAAMGPALAEEVARLNQELTDARQILTYISSPTVVAQPERYSDFGRCIGMAQEFFEKYPNDTGAPL